MTDDRLPVILEEFVELIGYENAMKLARRKGGGYVTLPRYPQPCHWLVRLIGQEAADILGEHYATIPIYIPQGPTGTLAQVLSVMRRRRHEALARGLSANDVAAISGYSVRQVYRAKADRHREIARGQTSLFDLLDESDTE